MKEEIYQSELSETSWARTPTRKAIRLAYNVALNLAIVLSIPFAFVLRDLSEDICLHKIFALQKSSKCSQLRKFAVSKIEDIS